MNKIGRRRRDSIIVVDGSPDGLQVTGLQCQNCNERNYLIMRTGDLNFAFCTNCGERTSLRIRKHERGLAEPTIHTGTVAVTPKDMKDDSGRARRQRMPHGINNNNNKKNPLEQYLIQEGFTVMDSNWNVPPSS